MKRLALLLGLLVALGWGLSPQRVQAGTCVRICPEAHTDTQSGRTLYSFTILQGSATCAQDQTNFCNTISGTPFCPSVPGSSPATLGQARRFCERDPEFYQAPEGTPSWCADLLAGRFLERPESGGGRLMSEQKCRLPSTETPPPAASTTPRTGGVPATQLTPSIPQLAVPIPGVTITAPTQNSDGTISVPYLAQYISGIYRYLLGISTIVAIIMVIYGGFLYLLASTGIQVASGKTIIQDALIGLVVLYGSYFILWNVNPDLVSLRPITLRSVRSLPLEVNTEGLTTLTRPADEIPPNGTTFVGIDNPGSCPIPDLPPGRLDCGRADHPNDRPCTPEYCAARGRPPGCSDNAPALRNDPRYTAFVERAPTFIQGGTPRDRVSQLGILAAQCQVSMGSCGDTAGTLRRMAGLGAYSQPAPLTSNQSSDLIRQVQGLNCQGRRPASNCVNGARAAVERAREITRPTQDAIANALEPGDWMYVYNGNDGDNVGAHSITFLGWVDQSGRARVVNGQWGRNVWASTVCLKTTCGNFQPILVRRH